jgi:AcrR family transcriptional regulator
MSSSEDKGSKPASRRRQYDSKASREALLAAAREVFDEIGYERATTREVGERAGVDPALIARYFGSKEGLFLAAIATGAYDESEFPADPKELLAFLLERWDDRGHNPINQAVVSSWLPEEMNRQARAAVRERNQRLIGQLRDRGVPSPGLRADIFVALALGVGVARANGTLEAIATVPREELLEALLPMIDALESPPDG